MSIEETYEAAIGLVKEEMDKVYEQGFKDALLACAHVIRHLAIEERLPKTQMQRQIRLAKAILTMKTPDREDDSYVH